MILLILRLLIAGLLALTGVTAEDVTLSQEGVIHVPSDPTDPTQDPTVLPGPSPTG